MCDYSLMSIPNRLASEDEDLVVHRFETGTIGLACQADLQGRALPALAPTKGFWSMLTALFTQPDRESLLPAVCIPPGASLLLMDISEQLQDEIGIGRVEKVTFTQITAEANAYRDAVRFGNGREILLQRLQEGQRLRVLKLISPPPPTTKQPLLRTGSFNT